MEDDFKNLEKRVDELEKKSNSKFIKFCDTFSELYKFTLNSVSNPSFITYLIIISYLSYRSSK